MDGVENVSAAGSSQSISRFAVATVPFTREMRLPSGRELPPRQHPSRRPIPVGE
jgi:hypothetical protein